MIELRVSEAAALSIVEQAEYYATVADRSLAVRWEAAVSDIIRILLKMPGMGTQCRIQSPSLTNLRWTLVPGFPNHMVFYRYSEQENVLLILQVLHGARDLQAILSESE